MIRVTPRWWGKIIGLRTLCVWIGRSSVPLAHPFVWTTRIYLPHAAAFHVLHVEAIGVRLVVNFGCWR